MVEGVDPPGRYPPGMDAGTVPADVAATAECAHPGDLWRMGVREPDLGWVDMGNERALGAAPHSIWLPVF